MNQQASPKFWQHYRRLSPDVQRLADKCYQLMRRDERHPSLHL